MLSIKKATFGWPFCFLSIVKFMTDIAAQSPEHDAEYAPQS
jgi:hypothetical protein